MVEHRKDMKNIYCKDTVKIQRKRQNNTETGVEAEEKLQK